MMEEKHQKEWSNCSVTENCGERPRDKEAVIRSGSLIAKKKRSLGQTVRKYPEVLGGGIPPLGYQSPLVKIKVALQCCFQKDLCVSPDASVFEIGFKVG